MTILMTAPMKSLTLPSGLVTPVNVYQCQFSRWAGPTEQTPRYFSSGKNPKPVVDLDGEPLFPELAVLRLFERQGWQGVWMDTFGQGRILRAWSQPPVPFSLENQQAAVLESIPEARGRWDIFAWQEDQVLFADAKWKGKDRSTTPQLRWMEAALNSGIAPSSFYIVEWSFGP